MAQTSVTEDYEVYEPDWSDAEGFPIEIDEGVNINLIEQLHTEEMRPRLWRFQPGDQLSYHIHEQQEELFYVVEGTGQMLVGSDRELVEIPEGGFFKPGIKTPRQLRNDTDEESVWLIVGAPNVMEGKLWDEYDEEGRPTERGRFADLDEFF